MSLKIADAEWSDKFSLDTVGSSGNVTCKNKAHGNSLEVMFAKCSSILFMDMFMKMLLSLFYTYIMYSHLYVTVFLFCNFIL